jgi:hypothetical protein
MSSGMMPEVCTRTCTVNGSSVYFILKIQLSCLLTFYISGEDFLGALCNQRIRMFRLPTQELSKRWAMQREYSDILNHEKQHK